MQNDEAPLYLLGNNSIRRDLEWDKAIKVRSGKF